ncbi:hypothetical protein F4861DRAFT_492046 [Xylaria intraflava]|nr:hypothetical protein F4861DRAFT_492046 [Xylaria intraflava]
MSLWGTFTESLASADRKTSDGSAENGTIFQGSLRSPRPSTSRRQMPNLRAAHAQGVISPRKQGEEQPSTPEDKIIANQDTWEKPAISPAELRDMVTKSVDEALESRRDRERSEITTLVVDYLLPRIQESAAKAAEQELDKFIEAARGETTREKLQAILSRVQELPGDALETLFLRRSVMASALRRVLQRVEIEDAVDNEWEDVGATEL